MHVLPLQECCDSRTLSPAPIDRVEGFVSDNYMRLLWPYAEAQAGPPP